jgi:hypothetical protein
MVETDELFRTWDKHPPTNILVKVIVEGLGGVDVSAPQGISEAELQKLAAEARGALPHVRGTDPGLPRAPVFDLDELRRRNQDSIKAKAKQRVG